MASSTRQKKKQFAVAVLVLLIVASISSMLLSMRERPIKPDLGPLLATAQVIAEETGKLLENQGQIVVITAESESHKVQTEAFESALKKQGQATLRAVEKITPEQMRQGAAMGGISSALFLKILAKYPDASAVVSLIGPPQLKADDIAKLPQKMPKIIVFSSFGTGVKKLLEQKVISLAIVSRMGPPPSHSAGAPQGGPVRAQAGGPPPPKEASKDPLRARFDSMYQIVKPDSDLSQLFEPPAPPAPPSPENVTSRKVR